MSLAVSPAAPGNSRDASADASALVASVLSSEGLGADDAAALAAALAAEFDMPVSTTNATAFATPAPKDSGAGVVDSVASEATVVAAEDDDDVPLWLREGAPKERRRVPPLAWSAAPMLSPAAEEAGSGGRDLASSGSSGRSSLGRRAAAGAGSTARTAVAAASPAPGVEASPHEAAFAALLLPADEADDDARASGGKSGATPSSSGARSRASPAAVAGRSTNRPQLVACRSLLGCTWHANIVAAPAGAPAAAAVVTATGSMASNASTAAAYIDDSVPGGRWGHLTVLAPPSAPTGIGAAPSSAAGGDLTASGLLLVAGGENAAGPCDDTWELDWARRAWKRRTTGALAPSLAARTWGGAVWLHAERSVLAYGGDRELTDASGAAATGSDATGNAASSATTARDDAPDAYITAGGSAPASKRKRGNSPSAASAAPAAPSADPGAAAAAALSSVVSSDSRCALYDADASLWYPATTTAVGTKACPGDRSGHSMVLAKDDDSGHKFAVVFGGIRGGRHFLSDTYVLTTHAHSFRWLHVRTYGKAPTTRCYHSTAVVGNKMVVFGGNNADQSFNDVHVLDMSTGLAGAVEEEKWRWSCPAITGVGPCRRTGAAAVAIGDRFVLVHGGWDPDAPVTSEDSSGGTSKPAASRASSPATSGGRTSVSGKKRSRPSSEADASTSPRPFSDAYILDCETWEWLRVMPEMRGASSSSNAVARAGHSAVFLRDFDATALAAVSAGTSAAVMPAVLIFGGINASGQHCNDVSVLLLPACLPALASC